MSNTKIWETNQTKKDLWNVTNFPYKMGKFVKNLLEEKEDKYTHGASNLLLIQEWDEKPRD